MGWVREKTGIDLNPLNWIESGLEKVGKLLDKGVDAIGSALKSIGNTIEGILKDPLPTLLQIGGSMIGIPPYVTAAAITAAKGGKLEDIAKSAAISYASTSFMSSTQIGADIKNYTSNSFAGDFTDSVMEKFNLTPDQAVQIAKVSTAAMNNALVGGINAALTGKSVTQGITSGFTSGLVYSSTDSFFDTINKDPNWGFSPQAINLMKGATSTALNTFISGKGDPAQAIGNYIAYATINMAGSTLAQAAKDAYKLLTTDTDAAKEAQDKYTLLKADFDKKVESGNKLSTEINNDVTAYQKVVEEQYTPYKTELDRLIAENSKAIDDFNANKKIYDDNKWAYENYDAKVKSLGYEAGQAEDGSTMYYRIVGGRRELTYDPESGGYYYRNVPDGSLTDGEGSAYVSHAYDAPSRDSFATAANNAAALANAAGAKADSTAASANKLNEDNKAMLDGLVSGKTAIDTKLADLKKIKDDVETPNADGTNLAAKLKAAADAYQTKYDAWAKTKDAADRSAENYAKALTEVGTRNATIDALNSGAIKVTGKDASGNWLLDNGMTLTTQGKFLQDGQPLFANAAGIPQNVMDFKAADGSNVDFNENAGRTLSETDVDNICRRDYGFTPTADEVKQIAGGAYADKPTDAMIALANKRAREIYFSVVGKEPTTAQMDQIRGSGNVVNSAADVAINGLDLPPDFVPRNAPADQKISFGQAYAAARAFYGPGRTFEWNGKQYTTESREEQKARLDKELANAQARINMMPASEVAGAGRGFFAGRPAGVEDIYVGKKDGNVYVDTRTFDAMGNVTSGELKLADDKTATNVRATGIIGQIVATGAQGFGELMQNYASAVSLATGSNLNNTIYNLGKSLEQWGKDRDSADVVAQSKKMDEAVAKAGQTSNPFTQVSILAKAVKDNPLGFISSVGKEVFQEAPPWAVGAVAGAVALSVGAGGAAVATTAAVVSAALNGLESFGSGGREAYDTLRAAGVPEDKSRELAIINGSIHAAVTAPAEFIADKALFKAYLNSVSGGVKEYAAKYGSTIATNSVTEWLEAVPQNASTQLVTTGKVNIPAATAGAFYEAMLGGGTVTAMAGPAAIRDAAIVAKDIAGNNVTLGEFMSGTKQVDLKTIDSSAVIGQTGSGAQLTMGAITAAGVDNGMNLGDLKLVLPSTLTSDSTVVGRAADGTAVTLGNINAMVAKNPTLSVSTLLEDVYTLNANEFKATFTPTVLNGTSSYQSMTDLETRAKNAGFPSYASYTQYNGDVSAYNNAVNLNLAKTAGFPDYGSYTQYNGDLSAYNAAKAAGTNTTAAGTSTAGTGSTAVTGGTTGGTTTTTGGATTTPGASTITGGETSTTTGGGTTATNTATTPGGGAATTTGGGTSTTTTGGGTTLTGTTTGGGTTTTTGGGTTSTTGTGATTTTGGGTTTTAGGATTGTGTTTGTGAATTTTGGVTMDAVTQAIQDAIAGIKLPAGVSMDSVVTAIKNYAAANPQLTTTDVATAIADYMRSNPPVSMADVSSAMATATRGLATKADIATAIAGIQFPAGITKEDVASAIEAYMSKNAGLSAKDVTDAVATYMQNNPGITTANVTTAVNEATKNLVTSDSLTKALTGVTEDVKTKFDTLTEGQKEIVAQQVQQGKDLTKAISDVSSNLQTQFDTLSGDVKTKFDSLSQGQKDLVASQVQQGKDLNKAIADVSSNLQTSIDTLSGDVKTKFDTLSQGQKDIVAQQVQQGKDLTQAISDVAATTTEQISQAKKDFTTQFNTLSEDVKGKFDTLSDSQKTIIENQVQQGKDLTQAINDASKLSTEQITNVRTELKANIEDTQKIFNTRVDELMKQGQDFQTATTTALKELGGGISTLQEEQAAAAKAARAKEAQSKVASNLAQAASLAALPAAAAAGADENTPFKKIGLQTSGQAKFEGPLEQYLKMVKGTNYAQKPAEAQQQQTQQQVQQGANVQQDLLTPQADQTQPGSDYFNYGQQTDIDKMLAQSETPGTGMLYSKAGGLATPLMAAGGTTRYGRYAQGGLNVVHHAGKPRVDFRRGDAVTGPGDGQSDDIPAMLADGEFVFPADVVAALGNGSTKAGSDKLYDMMHSIRAYHRSAAPEDLPPPAKKSPLDYLKKTRKARR